MYSLELLITIGLATTIAGLAIGYFVAQRTAPSQLSQRQLENHLSELQQQQENYQHEVSEHFLETAELLNQLTNSYRDVHNHLAKGAQMLAGDDVSEALQALPEGAPAEKLLVDDDNISPPLDYAPKTAPNQPGMLNEAFGLNKDSASDALENLTTAEMAAK